MDSEEQLHSLFRERLASLQCRLERCVRAVSSLEARDVRSLPGGGSTSTSHVREQGTELLQAAQNSLDRFLQLCSAPAGESSTRNEVLVLDPDDLKEPPSSTPVSVGSAACDNGTSAGVYELEDELSEAEWAESASVFSSQMEQESIAMDPDDIAESLGSSDRPSALTVAYDGSSSGAVLAHRGSVDRVGSGLTEASSVNTCSLARTADAVSSEVPVSQPFSSTSEHNYELNHRVILTSSPVSSINTVLTTDQRGMATEDQVVRVRVPSSESPCTAAVLMNDEVDGGRVGALLLRGDEVGRGSHCAVQLGGKCGRRKGRAVGLGGSSSAGKEGRGGGEGMKGLDESFAEFDSLMGEFESPDEFLSQVFLD